MARKSNKRTRKSRRSMQIESLETRKVMAAYISFDGFLMVEGSNGVNDSATVSRPNLFQYNVNLNGQNQLFSANLVTQNEVRFYGRSGNDYFKNNTNLKTRAYGESGDDTLHGGSSDDWMTGQSGNDKLYGHDGDDTLYGYTGNDSLQGGNGNDVLSGWDGNDWMTGQAGNDKLYGHDGNDTMYGYTGNDHMEGGNGDDMLSGWSGNDWMTGQAGDDTMYGHSGNDTMYGYTGDDRMEGGSGNDTMSGWSGNDWMTGQEGNDQMWGHDGNDTMYGYTGDDSMQGGSGNDTMSGWDGNDWMTGQEGNDELYGHAGHDELFGYTGNDTLFGGSGNDTLSGWSGNDNLYGHDGNDALYGHSGRDGLMGGNGVDVIDGGTGIDRHLTVSAADANESNINAKIHFRYGEKNWTYSEIEAVDVALDAMHHRTGSSKLLLDNDGTSLTFKRGIEDESIDCDDDPNVTNYCNVGTNHGNGTITLNDPLMDGLDVQKIIQFTFHEVAHSWQSAGVNTKWNDFIGQSGWRYDLGSGDEGDTKVKNGVTYVKSRLGSGWYRQSAEFVSNYATSSAGEDWADSFAAAMVGSKFAYRSGNTIGTGDWPAGKITVVNQWLNSI